MILNVTVTIQLDIDAYFFNGVEKVKDQLELMDNIIRQSELDSNPSIFVSNVDKSDIWIIE
jgi:hypothetical protein